AVSLAGVGAIIAGRVQDRRLGEEPVEAVGHFKSSELSIDRDASAGDWVLAVVTEGLDERGADEESANVAIAGQFDITHVHRSYTTIRISSMIVIVVHHANEGVEALEEIILGDEGASANALLAGCERGGGSVGRSGRRVGG